MTAVSSKMTMINAKRKIEPELDPDEMVKSWNPQQQEMDRQAIQATVPKPDISAEGDEVLRPRTISVSEAEWRVGKGRETIIRWCQQFGIGKRLSARSEWRIDPVALVMAADGDKAALDTYLAGDIQDPAVRRYLSRS